MKRIIIAGGGLAGLTTAYYLVKQGHTNITILEASEQLGGRIDSFQYDSTINSGAFMVFAWYKRYKQLLKELGLYNKLRKLTPHDVYYGLDEGIIKETEFDKTIPWTDKLRLISGIASKSLTISDFSIYKHATSKVQGNAYELLRTLVGDQSKLMLMMELTLGGYGYPTLQEASPNYLALFTTRVLRGWLKQCYYLEGGSRTLIDTLENYLRIHNVHIKTNQAVTSIDKFNKVIKCANGQEYEYDVLNVSSLAVANQYIALQQNGSPGFDNTKGMEALIRFATNDFGTQSPWFIFYLKHHNQVFSIFSPTSSGYKGDVRIKNLLVPLFASKEEVLNSTTTFLNNLFPNNRVEEVLETRDWDMMMPKLSREAYEMIASNNGKDSIYFSGDFLSGIPMMEAAVYWGKMSVERIKTSDKQSTI